ncbi:MAG: type II secretion system GspH family protein [Aquificaceae bacterium]|nr:type II secretion system GspH family protein [Aquificaceae bacterium]MDW8029704.1 type II secretion system protein [Armatimonadota bacterium]
MSHPLRKKGLTLIELLIVIGIIAVLAGILYVALASARRKAQLTYCINNFRQLHLALEEYRHDWDGLDVEVATGFDDLALPLAPYIVTGDWPFQKVFWIWGTQELWHCPAAVYRRKYYGGVPLDYNYRLWPRWLLHTADMVGMDESAKQMVRRNVAKLEEEFRQRRGEFVVLYHEAHAPTERAGPGQWMTDILLLRLNGQIQVKKWVNITEPQKW